jgi:hypothetical protein
MHLLLCVLLYLHSIVIHGTYTTQQIQDISNVNQIPISVIENSPPLVNLVQMTWGPEADRIIIIDTTEE